MIRVINGYVHHILDTFGVIPSVSFLSMIFFAACRPSINKTLIKRVHILNVETFSIPLPIYT